MAIKFRSNERPRLFIEVGKSILLSGKRYQCVERPLNLYPSEACSGCIFRINHKTCPPYMCSKFDRYDKKNIWFVEYDEQINDISR